jgi:hypothetical protein
MRSLAAALTVAAAISFAPLAQAAITSHTGVQQLADDTTKKVHHMKGTISSVDGMTVVVSSTNKAGVAKDHKIKTDDKTKITLDGKTAALSDLKAGQEVTITPGAAHGDPASEIEATSAAAK